MDTLEDQRLRWRHVLAGASATNVPMPFDHIHAIKTLISILSGAVPSVACQSSNLQNRLQKRPGAPQPYVENCDFPGLPLQTLSRFSWKQKKEPSPATPA